MQKYYFVLSLIFLSLLFNGCSRFNPNNTHVVFHQDQAYLLPDGVNYTLAADEKTSSTQYSPCSDGDVEWMEAHFSSGENEAYIESNIEMVNCTIEMKKSSPTNDARKCRKKLKVPALFKDNPYDPYCMVQAYSKTTMEICLNELYEFNKWNKIKLMKMGLLGCSSPMSERELKFRAVQNKID